MSASEDPRILQLLALPKGKRLLCNSWTALDQAGQLSLVATGVRLLPQFVASASEDAEAVEADAWLAGALADWVKAVVCPSNAPGSSTLAMLTTWLASLVEAYEAPTLKALLQHNGGAGVVVALLHRGEDECRAGTQPEADVTVWYVQRWVVRDDAYPGTFFHGTTRPPIAHQALLLLSRRGLAEELARIVSS